MGNYPIYVVKAMSKEDVSEGVKFASKHGLRLVIKNTGYVCLSLAIYNRVNALGRGREGQWITKVPLAKLNRL